MSQIQFSFFFGRVRQHEFGWSRSLEVSLSIEHQSKSRRSRMPPRSLISFRGRLQLFGLPPSQLCFLVQDLRSMSIRG